MGMKSDVHSMYMDEVRCGNNDLHPVSSNWFNSVWRVRVPHLKVRVFHRWTCPQATVVYCFLLKRWVPKHFRCPCPCVCRFAVCERCTEIEDHLQQATSEEERRLWLRAKKIHREHVSNIFLPSLYISSTQWHVKTQPLCVQHISESQMIGQYFVHSGNQHLPVGRTHYEQLSTNWICRASQTCYCPQLPSFSHWNSL